MRLLSLWPLTRSSEKTCSENLSSSFFFSGLSSDFVNSFQVVCKYIEKPVLFHREEVGLVKFDVRYMLLLRSAQPLRLYAYDVFWLRFANRSTSVSSTFICVVSNILH